MKISLEISAIAAALFMMLLIFSVKYGNIDVASNNFVALFMVFLVALVYFNACVMILFYKKHINKRE